MNYRIFLVTQDQKPVYVGVDSGDNAGWRRAERRFPNANFSVLEEFPSYTPRQNVSNKANRWRVRYSLDYRAVQARRHADGVPTKRKPVRNFTSNGPVKTRARFVEHHFPGDPNGPAQRIRVGDHFEYVLENPRN